MRKYRAFVYIFPTVPYNLINVNHPQFSFHILCTRPHLLQQSRIVLIIYVYILVLKLHTKILPSKSCIKILPRAHHIRLHPCTQIQTNILTHTLIHKILKNSHHEHLHYYMPQLHTYICSSLNYVHSPEQEIVCHNIHKTYPGCISFPTICTV